MKMLNEILFIYLYILIEIDNVIVLYIFMLF